jgi:dihydrofolate reductase
MTLSLIVAMTEQRVIGRNNALPWHLSEDLKRFKQITMGHPIIMGRKTFESIGRPLPGRQNIVLTREKREIPGVTVVSTLDDALRAAGANQGEVFVVGGAEVFKMALPMADKIHLTLIRETIAGDVLFPEVDWDRDFEIVERSDHVRAEPPPLSYSFLTAVRRKEEDARR